MENNPEQIPESVVQQNRRFGAKKVAIISLVVVILVLLVCGGSWWALQVYMPEQPTQQKAHDLYTDALSATNQNDFTRLADQANALRQVATSSEEKFQLGIFGSFTKLNYDMAGSNALLREIAADTSYTNMERAFAVQSLADRYYFRGGRQYALQYIFVDQPYISYIATPTEATSTDRTQQTSHGVRLIYEHALSFAQLPVSNYRVAQWYLDTLDAYPHDTDTKKLLLEEAEKYYDAGNAAMPVFEEWANSQPLFAVQSGYAQWLQAATLGHIADESKDADDLQEADQKFKTAIAELSQHGDEYWKGQLSWANLEYALFLDRSYGSKRSSDISMLLDTVVSDPSAVYYYLSYLHVASSENKEMQLRKTQISALSSYNSKFESYLKNVDWTL